MLMRTVNLASGSSLLISSQGHILTKGYARKWLIWTSNIVLDKLMKCNKEKQLSLQYESQYQMKGKKWERL